MSENPTLNVEALTASRQTLLSDALAGHGLELVAGKFSDSSRDSLAVIGLTPIEIAALEQSNVAETGDKVTLAIAGNMTPSRENNPFSREKWNPELQRQVHDTDPMLANQLFREARGR
ncbi:hypothetical protein [Methylomonas koyamae]|uniref:Uncharacterized protein n=1 Tax=Methylomonas koyamae TaxID=702114 RepID=A0A291IFN4_9GAMM|nr:hypothetical protein [Methylomonas koyamae]ATG89112.1 hypothetical protein MKLM6_0840 [Methylomonas koyamae]OAI29465.1 hypothetical protein A1356_23090 [Methylomonas koyamae]